MKPTKQLIRGLRETAQRLRNNPNDYCWLDSTRCNCGLLAQTLLGVDAKALRELRRVGNLNGCWTFAAAGESCKQTGLPLHQVFKALQACGLEFDDYARIEHLDGKLENVPSNVAAWMDAEADKLEARRAAGEKPELMK